MFKEPCSLKFGSVSAVMFDVLVHVFVLSAILQLLFEMKLKSTEHKALYTELEKSIQNGLKSAKIQHTIPSKITDMFREIATSDSEYKRANKLAIAQNRNFIYILGAVTAAYYCSVRFSCNTKSGSANLVLFDTLRDNSFMLIVVGIIEALFIFKVILKYVPTKPSFLVTSALERLQKGANAAPPSQEMSPVLTVLGYGLPICLLGPLIHMYSKNTLHYFSYSSGHVARCNCFVCHCRVVLYGGNLARE